MVATLDAEVEAGLERIRAEPQAFMREWLGADLWEKQVEIAESVRDHRRTAVKSCHSSGKSYLAARIVIWFLHAYPRAVVITTAPTSNQVENILWREIRSAEASRLHPLLGRYLTTRVEIAPDWYALGFKSDDSKPDRFQGFHAEHALVIVDEAAGVAEPVFQALDAVLTSERARMLLIGNPTSVAGKFYDAFHGARGIYHTITIAAGDTPNIRAGRTVRPYLITQAWIDDAIAEHGQDSPFVQSRVYAAFPTVGEQALIPLAWIERAHHARVEDVDGGWHAGLDVARMGGDENALCIRRGITVVSEHAWTGMDTMQSVGKAVSILSEYPPLITLNVDVVGIGAGVADRLRELGYPVVDVNVGTASSSPDDYLNLRCELWWNLRERFREGTIAGPIDEKTQGQLADIRYAYDARHTKPVIERKEDAKKRGIRSPDRAEALLLAFSRVVPQAPTGPTLLPMFASASRGGRIP